jgi:hypothetical protein
MEPEIDKPGPETVYTVVPVKAPGLALISKDTSSVVYKVVGETEIIVPVGSPKSVVLTGFPPRSKALADTLPPLLVAVIVY